MKDNELYFSIILYIDIDYVSKVFYIQCQINFFPLLHLLLPVKQFSHMSSWHAVPSSIFWPLRWQLSTYKHFCILITITILYNYFFIYWHLNRSLNQHRGPMYSQWTYELNRTGIDLFLLLTVFQPRLVLETVSKQFIVNSE